MENIINWVIPVMLLIGLYMTIIAHRSARKYAKDANDTVKELNEQLKSNEISLIQLYEKFKEIRDNAYFLIFWPDSQDFMEEPWFEKEAVLHMNESSAYFIPIKRIKEKHRRDGTPEPDAEKAHFDAQRTYMERGARQSPAASRGGGL